MELINIIELYNTVALQLRKHHNGYLTVDDFNLQLGFVEKELLQMFISMYEKSQQISEHLTPFKKTKPLSSDKNGWVEYPDDHAYRIVVEGLYVTNPVSEATIQRYPCEYLRDHQVIVRLSSKIAAPSMEKKIFYHTFRDGKIKLYPSDLFFIDYTYFRNPVYGKVKSTPTVVNGEDVETIVEDKPLEWRTITFKVFVVMLLSKFGVSLKDEPQYYATIQQMEDYYKKSMNND